jgi:hypothetical protein
MGPMVSRWVVELAALVDVSQCHWRGMVHCFTGLLVDLSFEKIVRGSYVFGHGQRINRWGTLSALDPPGHHPGRSYRH